LVVTCICSINVSKNKAVNHLSLHDQTWSKVSGIPTSRLWDLERDFCFQLRFDFVPKQADYCLWLNALDQALGEYLDVANLWVLKKMEEEEEEKRQMIQRQKEKERQIHRQQQQLERMHQMQMYSSVTSAGSYVINQHPVTPTVSPTPMLIQVPMYCTIPSQQQPLPVPNAPEFLSQPQQQHQSFFGSTVSNVNHATSIPEQNPMVMYNFQQQQQQHSLHPMIYLQNKQQQQQQPHQQLASHHQQLKYKATMRRLQRQQQIQQQQTFYARQQYHHQQQQQQQEELLLNQQIHQQELQQQQRQQFIPTPSTPQTVTTPFPPTTLLPTTISLPIQQPKMVWNSRSEYARVLYGAMLNI
jgi:hypothetical protein